MKWGKELGAFVIRAVLFFLLYYLAGAFVGIILQSFFSSLPNLWQPLLALSVYILVIAIAFYALGVLFAGLLREGWSIWLDGGFCLAVLAWGTVTTLMTDVAKLTDNFLWVLTTGWATPVYVIMDMVAGDNINYFKYVFVGFWLFISLAIFLGLRQKYVQGPFRKRLILSAGVFLLLIAFLLNMPTIVNRVTPRIFNEQTYPNIDGATAAIPLGQTLARELLSKDIIEAQNYVKFNTTHHAYVNIIEKKADIIFVAEPSDEEIALAEQAGIQLKLTLVGMDAFVFIVNKQNPIDNLSIDQIQSIYSGQIRNWKEIDGKTELPIIACQRSKNPGSQTLMENVVMRGIPMREAPMEYTPGGMGVMMGVIDYKNSMDAIGYTVYYYAAEMNKKENVKFLSVNGIACNKETIRSKEYPFSGPLYAITREGDESESVQNLLEFLQSREGQKLVERGGFVPLQ